MNQFTEPIMAVPPTPGYFIPPFESPLANHPPIAHVDMGQSDLVVVLIHGFCETKAIWNGMVETIAQQARVIAIDLPGFGDNPALTGPVTVGDFAEPLYHLLISKGIEKCVLVGHSLGGYVSLAFAEKFPQRLQGLVMFHSTAYSDSQERKQGRTKTIEFIERYGVEEFISEFFTPLFFEGRKIELASDIKMLVEMGKKTPQATTIETIKAMRDRKDRSKVLEKLSCPVMFIAGRNDNAVNFVQSAPQFALPLDCTVHIMPNTGHMGMLERPKETLTMLQNFLQHVKRYIPA